MQGAAELLKNIAEAKQNAIKSISPVIAEIGKVHNVTEDLFANLSQTLQGTAELLINIAETKQNAIKNIGPVFAQMVKVVGGLASSAPPLIKGVTCGLVCPLQSGEAKSTCQRDHCDNQMELDNLTADDFGDYGNL